MKRHYIQLSEAKCRDCLRCVRICPTKAMTYVNHQPTIQENECILCGKCYLVCPHSAKKVYCDLKEVEQWLNNKEKVVFSVAPSFVAHWPKFNNLETRLREKGVYAVEETAIGAKLVSQQYNKLIEAKKMKNIISTCCPSVVNYVEKEYPDLVDQLAPVVSPMIAHGMDIKKRMPDAKVVFISPCIAKRKEIDEKGEGIIDAIINMPNLAQWLEDGTIVEDSSEVKDVWEPFDGSIARLYPTPGGIIKTLQRNDKYKRVNVEGIDRIKQALDLVRLGKLEGYFFEMSACQESCLGGPLLSHFEHNEWMGQSIIRDNVNDEIKVSGDDSSFDMHTTFTPHPVEHPVHTEEAIQDMLYIMGKTTKEKEHNCGACGYETCREKAIAVLEGKADPKICLPNALEHAESISNLIIENTPNGIIVLDENKHIKEINPSALHMLDLDNVNTFDMPIETILPNPELITTIDSTRRVQYFKAFYSQYNRTFDHAIMRIENENYYVIILMDLTVEETKEKVLKQVRQQTVEITQEVIDNQMRTVQEIASLLGETTAKSKVALTKLKKAMEDDE